MAKGQPGCVWRGGVIGPLKAYVVVIAANDQIKRTLAVVLSRPTAIAVVAHIPNPDGPHNVEIGRGKIDADRGGLETVTVLAVMCIDPSYRDRCVNQYWLSGVIRWKLWNWASTGALDGFQPFHRTQVRGAV